MDGLLLPLLPTPDRRTREGQTLSGGGWGERSHCNLLGPHHLAEWLTLRTSDGLGAASRSGCTSGRRSGNARANTCALTCWWTTIHALWAGVSPVSHPKRKYKGPGTSNMSSQTKSGTLFFRADERFPSSNEPSRETDG